MRILSFWLEFEVWLAIKNGWLIANAIVKLFPMLIKPVFLILFHIFVAYNVTKFFGDKFNK